MFFRRIENRGRPGRVSVAEREMAKFDFALKHAIGRNRGISGAVIDLRFGLEQLVDALYRGRAALKDVDDPTHSNDGPDEQDHVGAEGDELADRDVVRQDLMPAGQQRDDHGDAEDELERGPEHAHQLNETKRAADVLAVEPLEEADLRLLAGKGADEANAGVILLGLGGDIGEAGLDALEPVVNFAAEILDDDAGRRHGRERYKRQVGADAQHEEKRKDAEEDGIGAVHERRAEQHAHRVQVVGHAGHDVAGAIALVEAGVLRSRDCGRDRCAGRTRFHARCR